MLDTPSNPVKKGQGVGVSFEMGEEDMSWCEYDDILVSGCGR